MGTFIDYYRVLKVGPSASTESIRTSFRRLAKKYHPDTSELEPARAADRMRLLIEAYRVLVDVAGRAAYDLRRKEKKPPTGLSYPDSLRRRPWDPYARALLIFYDLLNGSIDRALSNYDRLLAQGAGEIDPLTLLGFADFLDCTFLLAEGYQRKGRYREAVWHYEKAFREDREWNYFKNFRPELKQRIRDLYCRKLAKAAGPQEAIGYYRKLLDEYRFSKDEQAFFHKKIAERYGDAGRLNEAREHFETALKLKPNLTGTKKIRSLLGLDGITG
jgi:curved DNA-binding protein CbpA